MTLINIGKNVFYYFYGFGSCFMFVEDCKTLVFNIFILYVYFRRLHEKKEEQKLKKEEKKIKNDDFQLFQGKFVFEYFLI
jgi:hypothetical protein